MLYQNAPFKNKFPAALLAWGCAVILCFQGVGLVAQTPGFQAIVDVKEAIVGVPFELTFTLTDADGQRFSPPSFRDFRSAGGVSESRGVSIINGRTSTRQSWTFTLEPTKAGTFTIGPASVQVNGKVLASKPVSITVLSAAATSKGGLSVPPGKDDQVFIAGELSQKTAYPGQQVMWRLVLYTRVAIEGADLISLPTFDGFYTKERRRFDTRTQTVTIKGKKYAVRILHEEALFPQNSGTLKIGAAQIRVGIEQPGTQGYFFGPKPVTLTAQPCELDVKPLPDPVPDGFTGGVGQYSWEVSSDTTRLTTDDALTLVVTLKGNGDSRRFAPPKIAVPPTCEIFEPRVLDEEEYENESEIVHTKKLEYVILPKEPGVQEFTPVLTYFDVDSNRYAHLTAAPIHFEVTAGKNYHPPSVSEAEPLPAAPAPSGHFWDKALSFMVSPILWLVISLFALSAGIFFWWNKREKKPTPKLEEPVIKSRPQQVTVHAAHQRFVKVADLLQQPNASVFYGELLKALQVYLSARLDIAPAQLNHAFVQSKLAERKVTPIRAQALISIWQACEQAVYSGFVDASKMESDWKAADAVVHELEKELHG